MAQPTLTKEVDDLLKPAFRALKRNAMEAIRQTQEDMRNVLRVQNDPPPEARPEGLPAPRLQLRWEQVEGYHDRICHYELVFPLHEHDCRNDPGTGFIVVQLGRTKVGGGPANPFAGNLADCTPYRDGAHAQWDSAVFSDLPIYLIAPDGRTALVPRDPEMAKKVERLISPSPSTGDRT